MPSFEVLLPIGALGLYLFDSILLLYSNEVLFVNRGGRWGFVMSSPLIFGGRRLCFVNPLAPGVAQFRVQWAENDSRQQQEGNEALQEFFTALRPVRYLTAVLLVMLLALPVELVIFGTGLELLVLMASFYLVILVALTYIYVRHRQLQLSGRSFAALCFDSLACSPFAINLTRKLAMRRSLAGNPVDFAQRVFDAQAFTGLVTAIAGRVGEEQQREYGQTPRWHELEAYRQQLIARIKPPA
jgi:hypothetical protein